MVRGINTKYRKQQQQLQQNNVVAAVVVIYTICRMFSRHKG